MTRITNFPLALAFLATVACSGDQAAPTQPGSTPVGQSAGWTPTRDADSSSASLITCPVAAPQSTSAVIGPLGGILTLGNTRVVIPLSAVLFPTKFTLTIPESNLAEIDVSAEGTSHYLFELPVAMAIDYSRCNTRAFDAKSLSVWNIDPQSKLLLEQMISVDEKLTHTVIFTTIHLSGYAVAD